MIGNDRTGIVAGIDTLRKKGARIAEQAVDSLDANRDRVASGLDAVADRVHDRVDAAAEVAATIGAAAHGAADRLEGAARYVRDHDTSTMLSDLEGMVRRHPVKTLLVVLAAGYLAGRALQRD